MKTDALVIGAGVSGMAAALTLSRHGRQVTLVERYRRVGPLLRRFRRGLAWFDGGFHYSGGLLRGGALDVLFRYFGADGALHPLALDPDGFDRIITAQGRELRIPTGFGRVREALSEAFPDSAHAAAAYAAEMENTFRTTPFFHFDFEPDQVMGTRKGAAQSLAGFLTQAGAREDMIETLGGYGLALYGAPAEEIPLDFHAMTLSSLYHSAHLLRRGGDAIVKAMETALKRQGVQILCGRTVTSLHVADRAVTAAELDNGERLDCTDCIFTGHPKLLPAMLPSGEAPAMRKRVEAMANSFGLFGLFIEVDEAPEPLRASNLYRFHDHENFLAALSCSPVEGEDELPGITAFMPSRWEGGDERRYKDYKARETERVLAALLDTIPELRGRCRVVETASPRTYEAMTGTVGGAAYGVVQSVRQRPLVAPTGVRGLYLAGQSTLVAGVIGAMISGLIAAAHVVGIEPIWREVLKCR